MPVLDKHFDFKTAEPLLTEKSKAIIARTAVRNRKSTTFSITLPPTNVTGSLHVGHALNFTIIDILLRFHRQHGDVTLGQPGLDHAGIATQMVVANQLREQGINWQDLSREDFCKKVWEWKALSGGRILTQLLRLGVSIDLDRVCFTMDEHSSRAVLQAFVTLYKDGFIFRAKKIVNWDTVLKTAVSDLEVSNRQEQGSLWYIRYEGEDGGALTVATTRPETLFGDQAVAVHPEDERYKAWIGKKVKLPLTDRLIPVIADEHSDPEKGSGVVKITPAHDFNDFEVGQRHRLAFTSIMDEAGRLNEHVPEAYRALSVPEARKKVLADLEQQGLLEKTETIQHSVPYNDRSNSIIEPRVTDQWFLDAKTLAEKAVKAVREGDVRFVPDMWKNTYFEWMENIQPWCISRQIWWGHQIPVWHTAQGEMFCAMSEEEAIEQAAKHFGVDRDHIPTLTRDPDVLDTWFSSSLWPFSTSGWPDKPESMKTFFPTSVLVTGFDIIFFWVARMMMMSLYFTKSAPFKTVLIHHLIRDASGKKMSKSKGNVIDPLQLIDEYGADALRFTLAYWMLPDRDIRISTSLVENNRNFMTKIWNAAKFLELSGGLECQSLPLSDTLKTATHDLGRWLLHELLLFKKRAHVHIENCRFDLYAQEIFHFLKEVYCDIFIEGLKAELSKGEPTRGQQLLSVARCVFLEFLKVAHPVIPFITDTLWEKFGNEGMLLTEPWSEDIPAFEESPIVDEYIQLAADIRSLRGMMGLSVSDVLDLQADAKDGFLENNKHWFTALARLNSLTLVDALSENHEGLYYTRGSCFLCITSPQLDIKTAATVFAKKMTELDTEIARLHRKVLNEAYKEANPMEWSKDEEMEKRLIQEKARLESVKFQSSF